MCLGFTPNNIPKELFEADEGCSMEVVEGEHSNKKRKRQDPHHHPEQQEPIPPQCAMGVARIAEDD